MSAPSSTEPKPAPSASGSTPSFPVYLLLIFGTFLAYRGLGQCDFVNYDDFYMILTNPAVRGGLTVDGLFWGLTTTFYEYWHPVTWWSHMLDWDFFGANPAGHHWMSLAFHTVNTLLVFATLRRMTGMMWRSAAVAALFALHPLHVESVAWLAERKDLLSTFFFLLTVWYYVRYVEASGGVKQEAGGRRAKEQFPPEKLYFGLAVLFFGLGLMSKPMVVTLPFVLLLLDFWPLKRNSECGPSFAKVTEGEVRSAESRPAGTSLWALVREKLPFFVLAILSCVITFVGVKAAGNMLSGEKVSWGLRLANIPVSYVRYLWKTVFPTDLAALYPMPGGWSVWQVAGSIVLLGLITWAAIRLARTMPAFICGWLIFLGTLVPVVGILQVGSQAIADRYMYLPSIGLFTAVVWLVAEAWKKWEMPAGVLTGATVLALLGCVYVTSLQVEVWRNSINLWTHCLAVAPESAIAHYNYGYALQQKGEQEQAIEQYRDALRLNPDHLDANLNLGIALAQLGKPQEATNYYSTVLRIKPDYAKGHANMALALVDLGNADGAIERCNEALRLDPRDFGAYTCLGRAQGMKGSYEEAMRSFDAALRLNPNYAEAYFYRGMEYLKHGLVADAVSSLATSVKLFPGRAESHFQLALALSLAGRKGDAISEYRETLRLAPNNIAALNNLAWIFATDNDAQVRNGIEATTMAQRVCELTGNQQPIFIGTLAAAYAEAGQFDKAMETAQKASDLASSKGQPEIAKKNQELLELYRARKPYREAP